jgi:broad specificity phosphatase PhoE
METLSTHLRSFLSHKGQNFLFIRTGESVSNLAGTLAGWTDSKLSDYGKKQSNLLYSSFHEFLPVFSSFTSSDLTRAVSTLQMSTLYRVPFTQDELLREIFYGDHEGEHFDSMSEEFRNKINSMEYHAPNGESWAMVRRRALKFLQSKGTGNHFIVSHGGLICTLTYGLGLTDVLPNASVAGLKMDGELKLDFTWNCPEILNK